MRLHPLSSLGHFLRPHVQVELAALLDDLQGGLPALELLHYHLLVLKLLLVIEKAADLGRAVRRELTDVVEVPELRVVRVHRNDLVVLLPLVDEHLAELRVGPRLQQLCRVVRLACLCACRV